ncbi:MAG: tetratricopeptide repeat protein, partial [Selenomonadaceae bacterium]|nr:tetratricopeptide repeat protein [Selenomonadaceae bacterium]
VFQICETILSVLRELKLYHNENLLHGDLKPENIYIFRKTRQHVALLDFGSVQNLRGNSLTGEEEISYSKKYAAPEVIKAYDKVGLDRVDYFRAITTKADLFSVGSMMFTKLTGKNIPRKGTNDSLQKKRAEILNDFWEHEKNGRVKNINATVKESLIKFFDGALARNPDSRFDAEEMKERLVRLVNETAPPMTKISAECKAPPPSENFVGRERELAQLNTLLNRGENQLIFINGEGGLGKSSLALKLAWERRNDFEFFWTTFTDDLEQTIINLSTAPPYFVEGSSNPKDIFFHNIKCMRGYGDSAVLIIDNFDLPPEKMSEVLHGEAFAALTRLRMKIIFTCRHRPMDFASCVEVLPLSEDELLKLMRQYYSADDLENYLPQIIRAADFNTLIVEQSAKMLQQSWGQLSPQKILEQLKNPTVGGAIFDKLKALYDLSELTPTAKKILALAVLLPKRGINAAIFLRTHEEYQQDKIRILELSGWLKKSADNFISLHSLVREVCKPNVEHAQSECRDFVEKYSREISALSLLERISRRREQMEIISNAADMLNDSDGQLSKTAGELNYLEGRTRHAWHYYQEHWKIFLKLNPKPDTLEALEIMDKIAWSACSSGEFDKAVYFVESALSVAEREIGEDRAKLLPYYISFANIYRRVDDWDKATELYSAAIKIFEENGADDFTSANLFFNFGKFCLMRGEDDLALTYGNRAMEILNRRRDFPLTMTAEVLEIFAEWSIRKKVSPVALNYSCEATKIYEIYYGKEHLLTAESYINIARALTADKRFNEALKYLERAQKILEDTCGQVHPATGKAYLYTALALHDKGENSVACEWMKKAVAVYSKTYGQCHPYTLDVLTMLYGWQGRLIEF